jgi:endonuclease YncB( thermonuclease family)
MRRWLVVFAVVLASRLIAAEVEARAARRGLWGDREPVPPWEWRATEKGRKRRPARR